MRAHLVGVSGTGMGALAALLVEAGHEVSGSDVAFDPPIGPALRAMGVHCLEGYDARHPDRAVDPVVVGNAIRASNPEAQAAERLGLARLSMSRCARTGAPPCPPSPPVRTARPRRAHGGAVACSRAGFELRWFIGGIPKA